MTNLELTGKIKTLQETVDTAVNELRARDEEIKKLQTEALESKQKLEELKARIGVMTKDPGLQKDQALVEATKVTTQNVGTRLKESGLNPDEQAAVLKKLS